jgi:F-type H+-transporting ATPase subunit b
MMRRLSLSIAAGFGLAGVAMASEGGEDNLFAGDLGNAIWTAVIFVVLLVVLRKFAWGPLLDALQQREKFIRESLEKAKADREAAEAHLAEYAAKLREARTEASGIVEEGRRDAEALKQKIESDAHSEADLVVERARREIELAKRAAVQEIYSVAGRLATRAASKIVGRELKAEDHQRLIEESIRELGDLDAN